ncbi:hypothetical protein ABEB22_12705 [Thioclava sp. 'Guangxiensis']|uniref:hypothetical protein n=1 Tax=Thioclava sp. 'Guangxiensis' TaxID=3149044 RepID=UPI003877BC5E
MTTEGAFVLAEIRDRRTDTNPESVGKLIEDLQRNARDPDKRRAIDVIRALSGKIEALSRKRLERKEDYRELEE